MYKALIHSLTAPSYEHLMGYIDQAKARGIKNSPVLSKLIIFKFTIDTRSTVTVIREKIASLDQYMATVDGNLCKFTKHVKINRLTLTCRKERTYSLLTNPFTAYEVLPNKKLRTYSSRKQDIMMTVKI